MLSKDKYCSMVLVKGSTCFTQVQIPPIFAEQKTSEHYSVRNNDFKTSLTSNAIFSKHVSLAAGAKLPLCENSDDVRMSHDVIRLCHMISFVPYRHCYQYPASYSRRLIKLSVLRVVFWSYLFSEIRT